LKAQVAFGIGLLRQFASQAVQRCRPLHVRSDPTQFAVWLPHQQIQTFTVSILFCFGVWLNCLDKRIGQGHWEYT